MSDLDDVTENYDRMNEAGEGWDSIIGRVESVGDHRLAAHLRARAAGDVPEAVTEPPKERSAGNKAISVQSDDAETAAPAESNGSE